MLHPKITDQIQIRLQHLQEQIKKLQKKFIMRPNHPNPAVFRQGTPDNEKLVHLLDESPEMMERARLLGNESLRAVCKNGAYHSFYTRDISAVTCEYCKGNLQ